MHAQLLHNCPRKFHVELNVDKFVIFMKLRDVWWREVYFCFQTFLVPLCRCCEIRCTWLPVWESVVRLPSSAALWFFYPSTWKLSLVPLPQWPMCSLVRNAKSSWTGKYENLLQLCVISWWIMLMKKLVDACTQRKCCYWRLSFSLDSIFKKEWFTFFILKNQAIIF